MAGQISEHRESPLPDFLFNCPAEVLDGSSGTGDSRRLFKRLSGTSAQTLGFPGIRRQGNGRRRIRDVTIQLGGDVQAHQISRPQYAFAGNAMDDLVVDADQIDTGKTVKNLWCGPRPVATEHSCPYGIHFCGRNPRTDVVRHGFQGRRNHLPDADEAVKVGRGFNGQ